MTDLTAQIRAHEAICTRLQALADEVAQKCSPLAASPWREKATNFSRHLPRPRTSPWIHPTGDVGGTLTWSSCSHCDSSTGAWAWPCPTVLAIAEKLGIEATAGD